MTVFENSFNNKHPEMNDDETFIGNMSLYEYSKIMHKWKTIRMGETAYTKSGNIVNSAVEMVPVFVNKDEYENNRK